MAYIYIRNIIRFFVLVLLQVFILNSIQLFDYAITPFLYVLFILHLPFETPRGVLIFLSFIMGMVIDLLSNTYGLHTAAITLMAFLRPGILKLLEPRDGYEAGSLPRLIYYGNNWFIRYSLLLIIPHHLYFFLLERFSFQDFQATLINSLGSALFTFILVMISQYLFYRK